MRPDRLFLDGLGSHDIDDEACDQTTQIEAAIEPVGKACQVVLGVLTVLQGVVRPGKCGLEIAEDGVDPLEAGQVTRLEAADCPRRSKSEPVAQFSVGANNQWIQQLLDDWLKVRKKVKKVPEVVCAYEKAKTDNIHVVPWSSSTRLCTEPGIAIGGADHISIVKPNSANHTSVALLVKALKPYTGECTGKLATPDFSPDGDGWKVTMDTRDKQVRIMNIGKTELSYWIAEPKGNGLVILPGDVKKIAGDEQDNMRMLLLLGAADSQYSFRLITKQGDDRFVTVDADVERIRAQNQASRDRLVASLNAHLSTPNKGNETQAGLVDIAAQQVDKEYPGLPEGARWLVTADALSAASLEPASTEALKRAEKVSPKLAHDYVVQRDAAPRFRELDRKVLPPNETHEPAEPTPPNLGPKTSVELNSPMSEKYLQEYSLLAARLKATKGVENNGHMLDARIKAATGEFDAARKSMLQARRFDGAAATDASPRGQTP